MKLSTIISSLLLLAALRPYEELPRSVQGGQRASMRNEAGFVGYGIPGLPGSGHLD